MKTREATELFDAMYSARTMRDTYDMAADHLERMGGAKSTASTFRVESARLNAESNRAYMGLVRLGFCAYRDESRGGVPVLVRAGQLVAVWHGFGEVDTFA